MTTRFENGIVVTLGPNNRVIWNGSVVIEDERAIGIETATPAFASAKMGTMTNEVHGCNLCSNFCIGD